MNINEAKEIVGSFSNTSKMPGFSIGISAELCGVGSKLRKIEGSLVKIDVGTYGYCEETGEEIGLKRLEARPVATYTLEAQERREITEKQFKDTR